MLLTSIPLHYFLTLRTSGKEGQVDDLWPDNHLPDCEMREKVRNSDVLAETDRDKRHPGKKPGERGRFLSFDRHGQKKTLEVEKREVYRKLTSQKRSHVEIEALRKTESSMNDSKTFNHYTTGRSNCFKRRKKVR